MQKLHKQKNNVNDGSFQVCPYHTNVVDNQNCVAILPMGSIQTPTRDKSSRSSRTASNSLGKESDSGWWTILASSWAATQFSSRTSSSKLAVATSESMTLTWTVFPRAFVNTLLSSPWMWPSSAGNYSKGETMLVKSDKRRVLFTILTICISNWN